LSFAASLLARRNFKDADSGSLACPLEHLHLLMSRPVAAIFSAVTANALGSCYETMTQSTAGVS